jgi:hypothetical protein
VRGIDGASWYNTRPPGVARVFQVSQHFVEPHADVPSNILENSPSRPDGNQEPINFRPEVAVIILAFSLPGGTKWLAWVAPANNVNSSVSGLQFVTIQ